MSQGNVFDLDGKVRVFPSVWPDRQLKVQPGDLSKFAPYGNSVYGYQGRDGGDPFKNAPSEEGSGGIIYFDSDISQDDFNALLRILEIHNPRWANPPRDYAIFTQMSEQPGKDGYLTQMRIVSRFGLRFMYKALDDSEYDAFPKQDLTMPEALFAFIEHEKQRWGTSFTQDGERGLQGLFGGDGDYAREELSFGLMVENSYNHIYRIWSRAWLVTK